MKKIGQKKRTKRSAVPSDELSRSNVNQVDEMKKFSEDDENQRHRQHEKKQMNDDGTDYNGGDKRINGNQKTKQEAARGHHQQQKNQAKTINSEEYRDYAFDTTDTDQFNEDDDLLRRYYNHPVRRAAHNDFDTFSDLMRLVSGQGDREDQRFVKQLHYGNDDSFLNDEANDADNGNDDVNNDHFNSEYDEYDDY